MRGEATGIVPINEVIVRPDTLPDSLAEESGRANLDVRSISYSDPEQRNFAEKDPLCHHVEVYGKTSEGHAFLVSSERLTTGNRGRRVGDTVSVEKKPGNTDIQRTIIHIFDESSDRMVAVDMTVRNVVLTGTSVDKSTIKSQLPPYGYSKTKDYSNVTNVLTMWNMTVYEVTQEDGQGENGDSKPYTYREIEITDIGMYDVIGEVVDMTFNGRRELRTAQNPFPQGYRDRLQQSQSVEEIR